MRVAAAGVNRADVMQRLGHYPPPPGEPAWPGLEVSGTVAALGPAPRTPAGRWATRSARCSAAAATPSGSRCRSGSCSRCRTASGWWRRPRCPRWPARSGRTCSWRPGCSAARPCSCTAASSGIGTMAVQLAHALGARVAVTAGSADKLARCAELGAEVLVNYRDEDFVERVRGRHRRPRRRRRARQHGRDVPVPQRRGARHRRTARGHRAAGRREGRDRPGRVLRKRVAVMATSLRARPAAEKADDRRGRCASWSGRWWPTAPCARSCTSGSRSTTPPTAHRTMEESSHVGKLLLVV